MRFRTAVKLSKGHRYIQRTNGNTIFDVVKYLPELLGEDDLVADDWQPVTDEKVTYK